MMFHCVLIGVTKEVSFKVALNQVFYPFDYVLAIYLLVFSNMS